jgi:glyoxylase-like metal-dependent hydrolase (beta-lactamase superfamily II)
MRVRLAIPALAACTAGLHAAALPRDVTLTPGAVNRVRIGSVAIYGDAPSSSTPPKLVFLTHGRREIVTAAEEASSRGAGVVAPAAEREQFENPQAFWEKFEKTRFHDYAQPSTHVPTRAIKVLRAVRGGEVVQEGPWRFDVLDTPGFTPGAVSYVATIGGVKIAFTGDLVLAGGRLTDLYSLQDAIPEAKARGYHGYAARAGALVASLRRVAAVKPDAIVPSRGPVITNPTEAITQLIGRLQALMASHFSTDALLWYWGPENLRIRSSAVLEGKSVDSMPMAEQRPLPAWIAEIANSRLILSKDGAAFLIDGGYRDIVKRLDAMKAEGRFERLEGIWITHYHDDHTDNVQAVADRFDSPVHTTARMADILANPSRYRMPCLTTAPIRARVEPEGRTIRWHEFQLTFHDFPGQTLYHGGLHVRRDSGEEIFFVGDSFTPSGIDDYCLHNRNILRGGKGYLYCLDVLRRYRSAWLINQHVSPVFRFADAHYTRMNAALKERMLLLDELSPWPDRNFMLDESWARMYPYGQESAIGEFTVSLRILNHAPDAREFEVRWNPPPGVRLVSGERRVRIGRRAEGSVTARFRADTSGLYVITAGVRFGAHDLPDWAEAMVRVTPGAKP